MADCAELSKLIHENVLNLGSREDVKDFDDVVVRMQEMHPKLHRDAIVQAVVEATTREGKMGDEIKKKVAAIVRQVKVENWTKEKNARFEQYLETGTLPPKTTRITKATTDTIARLRATFTNLKKWVETGDPAMQKKLSTKLAEINKRIEAGEIYLTEEEKGDLHRTIQEIQDQVNAAKKSLGDERTIIKLEEKVDELYDHLEAGTLPEKGTQGELGEGPADVLRSIVKDLRRQISKSEPAVKARLDKQISDLEELIKSGDVAPKQKKAAVAESKELEERLYRRDLLREELRNKIYSAKPVTIWGRIEDVFDLKRLLQTTGEMSISVRQLGIFAGTHPIQWSEATLKSLRALGDPVYRYKVNREIFNDPDMPIAHRSNLHMIPIGSVTTLTAQDEYLMSRWSERIPVVREFTQAAITLINLVRFAHWKTLYRTLGTTEAGMSLDNAKFLANAVNVFGGRGLMGPAENMAVALNRFFYAPKWVISRFQVLYGQPIWHQPMNREISLKARGIVAKEYGRFFISLAAFYSLMMLAGGELDDDRHSSTFGQVRFPVPGKPGTNKYLDPTMGIGRIIALHAQLWSGIKKSDATTKEIKLNAYTRFVELAKYGRGKLGPLPADIIDFIVGETIIGEKVGVGQWLKEFPPIAWKDVYDVMTVDLDIDENTALSILTFFGMSLSVHEPRKSQRKK